MMSVITTPLKKGLDKLVEKFRSFNIAHAGKWTVYFILIGVIAGLGSIVFHYLCRLGGHEGDVITLSSRRGKVHAKQKAALASGGITAIEEWAGPLEGRLKILLMSRLEMERW